MREGQIEIFDLSLYNYLIKQTRTMRNYTEQEVIDALNRKHDIRVVGKTVNVLYGSLAKCDLGIKAKGKIDFLHTYRGFHVQFVHKFSNNF